MGNSQFTGIYNLSCENEDKQENESHIYRNPHNPDFALQYKHDNLQSLFSEYFKSTGDKWPVFSLRKRDKDDNPTKETFSISLGKLRKEVRNFGRGLLELDLCKRRQEFKNYNLRFLGVYAQNSFRYVVQDLSCIFYDFVSIPIYNSLGEDAVAYMFQNTNLDCLCLLSNHMDQILNLKKGGRVPELKTFIIMDDQPKDIEDKVKAAEAEGLKVLMWQDVLEAGSKSEIKKWSPVGPDSIYCFSYTSGTTGNPKAAMLSHRNLASCIQGMTAEGVIRQGDRHLSYLPMAHVFERIFYLTFILNRCKICLFSGDVRQLKDDLAIFKPTLFASVPRIYNKFYDKIMEGIKGMEGTWKGNLINKAIKAKLENLETKKKVTHFCYDRLVFNKMKAILGGEVRLMITGSAPISKKVASFMQIAMCCSMTEGYGQTEGLGGQFGQKMNDYLVGHVGGVVRHLEFKLVDVPEMDYTHKDVDPETGLVTPRGEIWCRGPSIIPDYYKDEDKFLDTTTEDGWLKSGDIGMILPPQNRMVIIDRKKNIFKLSQGEYVAPEKIESELRTCSPLITDTYIYGNSLKSCLIAIVTIEPGNQRKLADHLQVAKGVADEDLKTDADLKKAILDMLNKKGREVGFKGFEIPKGLLISSQTLEELNLITPSFKMKRKPIENHFKAELEAIYKGLF